MSSVYFLDTIANELCNSGTQLCIPFLSIFCAWFPAEICVGRALVDAICQLDHYSSGTNADHVFENCARTTVTPSGEGLRALITPFENL
ncbi:hypothetical protein TNCV_5058201 [Trichonephila clavipes]|nr:hypothetical protein TNCV_5058201 [Trichonephila clavipes]